MAVVKRLSKVARELNVGISTIVEFLGSQGKEVSSNPNTKIGEDLYMILLEEYQKEKFEKEKADNVVIDQTERKVISIKKEEPNDDNDLWFPSIFQCPKAFVGLWRAWPTV